MTRVLLAVTFVAVGWALAPGLARLAVLVALSAVSVQVVRRLRG